MGETDPTATEKATLGTGREWRETPSNTVNRYGGSRRVRCHFDAPNGADRVGTPRTESRDPIRLLEGLAPE